MKLQIAESFKFRRCAQNDNESISEFDSRLRKCASTCNYETFLERALKEQFTVGLRNKETQLKLLSKEHSLEESIQQAIADEAAFRESAIIVPSSGGTNVNHVKQFPPNKTQVTTNQHSKNFRSKAKFAAKPVSASSNTATGASTYKCYSCGQSDHNRSACRFREVVCNKCSQKGLIAKVCISAKAVHSLEEVNEELYHITSDATEGLFVNMDVEGRNVKFQIDTGCGVSIVPMSVYKLFSDRVTLKDCNMRLNTYTGEVIKPSGKCDVHVTYQGHHHKLSLIVVDTTQTIPLLGKNWLNIIQLDWASLRHNSYDVNFMNIASYSDLFDDTLGCYTEPIKLTVTETPTFHRAKKVPYAIQSKVEETLNQMESDGIILKVKTSSCAAPIVPIEKKSGDICICGDFRVTYNKCSTPAVYPIPRIDDLHASLRGCKVFSTLDMSQAYHQLPIHLDSQKWLTINTHLGLYMFQRCPNGIHTAPALFQEIMDKTLAGVPHTITYLDDILVAGISQADHDANLCAVFDRLRTAGFKLNKSKCTFNKSSVTYLAHRIDSEGLHPTEEKVRAIMDADTPRDVKALRSFLGLIMFYSKFLENHSTVLAPLNTLLCKDVPWNWTENHDTAFLAAKEMLVKSPTLVHYDDNLSLYMSCDASAYGCGGVLFHCIDNNDRPVVFASCSLSKCQKNYSQLDKEAFSIIFCLKRFHQFLYGRSFHIITDHKPLLQLLGEHKPVPVHTAARLQRYSLILASYNYKLEFRSTKFHVDADCMSRVLITTTFDPPLVNLNCNFFSTVRNINQNAVKRLTQRHPLLSKVYRYIVSGWPDTTDPSFTPFRTRKDELSTEDGCILWGQRVIVPPSLQKDVLQEFHVGHPGICRMKALARSYIWWPNLDESIEDMVQDCSICQSMRNQPAKAPYHPWTFPTAPWTRLHIDLLGPVNGSMYFVLVDAYSKYPEVIKMNSITSTATIRALREILSRHGLPKSIVSDNGTQFTSAEFQTFCEMNGIANITTAVYKPSTNGQCERVVQIVKSALKQARLSGENSDITLPAFLLRYRITPHTTTGQSPSMLLYGRQLCTRLDLIRPSVSDNVTQKQQKMMDKSSNKCRLFQVGDKVRTRTFSVKGTGWIEGEITEVLGNRHYTMKAGSQSLKRHIDQIISRMSYSDATTDHADIVIPVVPTANPVNSSTSAATTDHHVDENASPESTSSNVHSPSVDPDMSTAITPVSPTRNISDTGPQRSSRVTKPPSRYQDYTT